MKYSWGVLVSLAVMLFVTLPSVTYADHLNNTNITASSLQRQADGTIELSFTVVNQSDITDSLVYGVRLQAVNGTSSYEVQLGEVHSVAQEEVVEFASVTLPRTLPSGEYDAFLLSRSTSGVVKVLKYLGGITLDAPKTVPSHLSSCRIEEWPQALCGVIGDVSSADIHYRITEGSLYGTQESEGVIKAVPVTGGEATLDIPTQLTNGVHTITMWLEAPEDAVTTTIDLGDAPLAEAYTPDSTTPRSTLAALYDSYAPYGLLIVPLVLVALLLWVALRRPSVGKIFAVGVIVLGTAGSVYAAITLIDTEAAAYVFNGFSKDSGKTQYQITFDSPTNNVSESIGLTVVMQETTPPNNKPSGASITVQVPGRSPQTLIASTDSSPIYHRTIGAITTAGTYTLTFSSPDLCGSAFNFSRFVSSYFGSTSCTFTMPLTIVNPHPPTTPHISGNCTVGIPCTISMVSTDADGDSICYNAENPTGYYTNAGCKASGSAASISRTFYSCSASEATVRAQATDATGLISAWGVGSPDIAGTIQCVVPCPVCITDGGASAYTISATPLFVPADDTPATISWSLANVQNCTITGSTVSSGATVSSWDWDVVRLNTSRATPQLTESVRYTLSCDDLSGSHLAPKSVTISNIPRWQEF